VPIQAQSLEADRARASDGAARLALRSLTQRVTATADALLGFRLLVRARRSAVRPIDLFSPVHPWGAPGEAGGSGSSSSGVADGLALGLGLAVGDELGVGGAGGLGLGDELGSGAGLELGEGAGLGGGDGGGATVGGSAGGAPGTSTGCPGISVRGTEVVPELPGSCSSSVSFCSFASSDSLIINPLLVARHRLAWGSFNCGAQRRSEP
jgi:hypothetical protein